MSVRKKTFIEREVIWVPFVTGFSAPMIGRRKEGEGPRKERERGNTDVCIYRVCWGGEKILLILGTYLLGSYHFHL